VQINKELYKHVAEMTELYLQRNWKFLEDASDAVEATKEVIPYLQTTLTISEDDFIANYQEAVNHGLKTMRQSVQSEGKKRAQGVRKLFCHTVILCNFTKDCLYLTQLFVSGHLELWDTHGCVPTPQDILEVLALTPDQLKAGHQIERDLVLWYFDRYLPVVVKKEFFGDNIRFYKRYTDKMNVNGEQKVCVTLRSEAFGLLVMENCVKKWRKIFELKDTEGKKAVIPSKGEAALPHKGKWTDPKCGQVKFGGWGKEALEFMSNTEETLFQLREEDQHNNHVKADYYKELIRNKHGISDAAPGKKRRRKSKDTEAAVVAPPVKVLKRRNE